MDEPVVVVTGGGNGLGRATSLRFADGGYRVAVLDIERDAGEAAVSEIGSRGSTAAFWEADVADQASVLTAIDAVMAAFGRIDVLVNNAAIIHRGTLSDLSLENWDSQVRVNLTGVFIVSQAVARHMMRVRTGRIINIASVTGLFGMEDRVGYIAAKGGVISMSLAAAIDLAPHNIRVNVICPGLLDTRLGFGSPAMADPEARRQLLATIPLGRAGTPEEVADIAHFLASPSADYMTGSVITVDGGWSL